MTSLHLKTPIKNEDPVWIVNDIAELGVKINGRCFFLYKGSNIQYVNHDDGTPMLYRRVGKREFGETVVPIRFYLKGVSVPDRYTEQCLPGICSPPDTAGEYEWQPMPIVPTRRSLRQWLYELALQMLNPKSSKLRTLRFRSNARAQSGEP